MCFDEVACSEGTEQRQLPSQDSGGNDAGECLRVLTRLLRMSASNAEHIENTLLGSQDGASANCPDLDTGHRNRDKEVFAVESGSGERK